MHMISKKYLSEAEMDTFDEIVQSYDSHNPPMQKCKRTKRQLRTSKNWVYS